MKHFLLLIAAALLFTVPESVNAQTQDVKDVRATIEQLFDGMRASDSAMVADAFTKDAIMKRVATNQEGEVMVNTGNLDSFLNAIGSPKEQVWDERIGSYDINIDGNLATVWTPFEFYIGDKFSHCGVNSFQLVKKEGDWKIFFIVDTSRQSNCVES
ncbi:nuclear transport factor 2 family protein [Gracilimonas sediminicola]|uniref:Nuclear transport factor 2 family protein n=1 Tax=Gracilimonas sediminicola TaxID=2952158 RepID=A0A9X2RHQ0_9BACT|nr:nuclear transport factor 2 family protein [Gracilimonas sediminicola]MCP9292034.1 nuclear transport factor 2 family protein [Gracilimonas sediminicola]